jgi:hypothetical protein
MWWPSLNGGPDMPAAQAPERRYFTLPAAAVYAGLSRDTLRRMIAKGELKAKGSAASGWCPAPSLTAPWGRSDPVPGHENGPRWTVLDLVDTR